MDTILERTCGVTSFFGGDWCGKPSAVHYRTVTGGEGGQCKDHLDIPTVGKKVQQHKIGPCCGMPGSHWDYEENVCQVPYEEDELSATQEKVLEVVG